MTTPMEDYLFDLQGYLVIKGALSPEQVRRANESTDALMQSEPDEDGWIGNVQRHGFTASDGVNLQNIVEAGDIFEELIDNPNWIDHAHNYVHSQKENGLFIDECFVNVRGAGQGLYVHSGGWKRRIRTQFRFHDGEFHCGQINTLTALTDIGPGDGATLVVPGSHKSNLQHPQVQGPAIDDVDKPAGKIEGAIEVHLEAGDTLLFVDALCHGAVARTNSGERRILIYRYGPGWARNDLGYQPTEELLARLTPDRRQILQPVAPRRPRSSL